MKCTCGWIDSKVRWGERGAIEEGNRHIRASQQAANPRARREAAQNAAALRFLWFLGFGALVIVGAVKGEPGNIVLGVIALAIPLAFRAMRS